jgi:predicted MFS family arabinose efflux permease
LPSEFHLSKEALGSVLTASPLGLFFGAFLGGRVADFWATATQVLQSLLPLTGAAAIAALLLMFLPRSDDLAT